MTKKEHQLALQQLKDNLKDNLAVYHERITLLIKLTAFDIDDNAVNFKARIIKPLDREIAADNRLFADLGEMDEFSFGAAFSENHPLIRGNVIGRPYCPFRLWLDPELADFINNHNDAVTKEVAGSLYSKNGWRNALRQTDNA